jgi:hypothetical protein
VQEGGSGLCDALSDGVCITRGTQHSLFNSVTDTDATWGDSGPADTGWNGMFPCSHLLRSGSTWGDAVTALGIRRRDLNDTYTFCMEDETTGEEYELVFDSWMSGSIGDFAYTRSQHSCACEPGFSGDFCEIAD